MIHNFLKSFKGGYFALCWHRSHRFGLRCYRGQAYDHQCGKHNETCFNACR